MQHNPVSFQTPRSSRTRRTRPLPLASWCLAAWSLALPMSGTAAELLLPATRAPVHLTLPATGAVEGNRVWIEAGATGPFAIADRVPVPDERGQVAADRLGWVANVPPASRPEGIRRLRLGVADAEAEAIHRPQRFRFSEVDDGSLMLWEGSRPVFVYNHGMRLAEGAPASQRRSSYVHPLHGLDGEILTDDFPADHYHHRGLFWAWPHVRVGERNLDLWMLRGIEQRFERWLVRQETDGAATLAVENGWYANDRKVVQERIWLRVYPADSDAQAIDLEGFWIPTPDPITLAGAEGKSYGGVTLRFAPRTHTLITTPLGTGSADLAMTRLPWADFTARFAGRDAFSGAALFIADDHPDYPPTWLTRHYGVLCIGWPGVEPQTFPAGTPIRSRYRVWIHRGKPEPTAIQHAYDAYLTGLAAERTAVNPGLRTSAHP